jgi:hypothetical protein
MSTPLTPLTPPKLEQIVTATQNLENMQKMNDYIQQYGWEKIDHAYNLLSEPDRSDKGLIYFLNLVEAAFKVIAGALGPEGAFVANFLTGMMSYWSGNPPESLKAAFAEMEDRCNATFIAVDQQLATYIDGLSSADPGIVQKTWDTSFEYNGQSFAVSDLIKVEVPIEKQPNFYPVVNAAIRGLDQQIWQQMLTEFYRVPYRNEYRVDDYTDEKTPPTPWVQDMLAKYKYAYYHCFFHEGDGGDCSLWIADEYDIEKNVTGFYDLNDDCCDYIFIDAAGKTINQDGLFTRQQVVDFLGIQINPDNDYNLAKEYKKAKEKGKTLLALFQSQGRDAIENPIIQKAQEDAVFAQKLAKDPKSTVEEFFDIKIPEHVFLTVVLADTSNYGLVIHSDNSFSDESSTFLDFLKNQGYDTPESRIIQKAQSDKMFRYKLVKNPKNTLDEYLGIKIPENISLTVVVEDPMNFGLLISGAK